MQLIQVFNLLVLIGTSTVAHAEWTAESPVKAIVWSFDNKCARLKMSDGSFVSVEKAALKLENIESRVTTIEFHSSALPKVTCK